MFAMSCFSRFSLVCEYRLRAMQIQHPEMDQTVHQTVAGLDDWLADRLKEGHFFSEFEVLKAACHGQHRNGALARLESLNFQTSCGQVKVCCVRKTVFICVHPCPSVVERILV
jgi:hypothetical protein